MKIFALVFMVVFFSSPKNYATEFFRGEVEDALKQCGEELLDDLAMQLGTYDKNLKSSMEMRQYEIQLESENTYIFLSNLKLTAPNFSIAGFISKRRDALLFRLNLPENTTYNFKTSLLPIFTFNVRTIGLGILGNSKRHFDHLENVTIIKNTKNSQEFIQNTPSKGNAKLAIRVDNFVDCLTALLKNVSTKFEESEEEKEEEEDSE